MVHKDLRRHKLEEQEVKLLLERMAGVLREIPGLIAAVLYGSVAEGLPFRDVDVALVVDRRVHPPDRDWELVNRVADRLEAVIPFPPDVHVVNDAPVALRYNVTKGKPFLVRDREAWYAFMERAWDMYFDFAPFARRYLEEMAGER